MIKNVLAGIRPAVMSDKERDECRNIAIATNIVDAFVKAMNVKIAVFAALFHQNRETDHHIGPVTGVLRR